MNPCADRAALLPVLADGELDLGRQLELERHLDGCPACAAAHQSALDLRARLRAAAPYYAASPALARRIRAGLEPAPRRRGWLTWPAAAATAAAILLLLFLPRAFRAPDFMLAQQVEAAHVRSLEVNHLMDVASTDQHTVKPWFHGHLDYAPPVADFAAQGYPLIGGRLDYLDHRAVAALVYRRRLHPINVFVWPSTSTASRQELHRDGYTLLHWSRNGMTWWVVSDVDTESLRQLATLLGG